ncbi:MAG: shikimate dehydrogenase [Ruminococcaceae bacterium]|nr:shikimate dehydrogenase [Oscillospiraceae bacterium]
MEYGCIGEHLKHSFSKEIHESFADYKYEICEVPKDKLDEFMTKREFRAINVTIPYKQDVIPYLYEISDMAKAIGAVNTIVNKNGRLYGHNTDLFGMTALIRSVIPDLSGKKVIITGTGGTSKTTRTAVKLMGASEIVTVSRTKKEGVCTYDEMYEHHSDADVLINTTPCGMYPDIWGCPVELNRFKHLSAVIDAVYNPLRTELILSAKEKGIPARGGLYMLVAQAVAASAIFTDRKEYPDSVIKSVYEKILSEKENIVLIGMPGCGKSTIGRLLSERSGKALIDTDELIVEYAGKQITDIFAESGEKVFRDMETKIIKERVAHLSSRIIAVGGGAVLRDENVRELRKNGKLIFLDRPLEQLIPTSDRPLASTREAVEKRYSERYPRYCSSADKILKTDGIAEHAVSDILNINE